MEEWKEYKLGEILLEKGYIRGPFGSSLRRGDLLSEGIPVYEQQHAIYGKRDFRFYISEDKYNEMKRFTVYPNDIIISCSGTVGEVSLIKKEDPKGIISQALLLLRSDATKILPEYLLYFFKSAKGHNSILSRSSGSVQVNIARREVIEGITLNLPNLEIQDKIVSILKSLDDKIENNRKINENLEQQAQALFKSWFVDFEPFRDQPFVESELGMIPEGWRVGTLGEIATISKKSINPANEPDKLYSHYSLPAFDDNQYPQKQFGKDIKSNKFLFNEDSILLSKLNPTIKRVWYVDKLDDNPICSTEFLPIETINIAFIAFVYCCIKDELYYSKLLSGVTGATNSHQRLSPNDIVNLRIPINEKSIEDFNLIVLPMLTMINANIRDNLHLSHLRDTLLPKLMSGELKIS